MAWTNPRTWIDGERVTAALLNTQVRDNLATIRTGVSTATEVVSADVVDVGGPINDALRKQFALGGRLWVPAEMFQAGAGVGGTPSRTHLGNRWGAWLMDAVSSERLTANLDIPEDWGFVDVDLVWANAGTGTGNIVIDAYLTKYVDTASTSGTVVNPIATNIVATASDQNRRVTTRLANDVPVSPGLFSVLMVDRDTSNAATNTLANDAAFIGVLLTRKIPVPAANLLTGDGAWCWFNEPRLLCYNGIYNRTYAGYVTKDGSVGVTSLDSDSGQRRDFVLHPQLQVDDHDVPGLVVLADGRLQAYYSKHSVNGGVTYMRETLNPENIGAWTPEVQLTENLGGGTTGVSYPKPARVGSRIYRFFRGDTSSHAYTYSDDEGNTWQPAKRFFTSPDGRPYVNFHVSDDGRIDFIATNAHPDEATVGVNLYHWYILNGNVYKTDGTLISALADISLQFGLRAADVSTVYHADTMAQGNAWGWDICRDSLGRPRVAFATFPSNTDHRYKYARWTGTAWSFVQITSAGGTISEDGSQPKYSGGIGILDSNPNTVYLSTISGTQWEIHKWTSTDDGVTWAKAADITTASTARQVRPTTPVNHYPGAPEVAWMSGRYTNYLNYDTDLLIHPGEAWPT